MATLPGLSAHVFRAPLDRNSCAKAFGRYRYDVLTPSPEDNLQRTNGCGQDIYLAKDRVFDMHLLHCTIRQQKDTLFTLKSKHR